MRSVGMDLADIQSVRSFGESILKELDRLDLLINNAGINLRKQITEFTLEEWRSVIDANLTSVFLMCRSFVPHMKGHGYGRIINVASTVAHMGFPMMSVYCATKFAVRGFSQALRLELAPAGIQVFRCELAWIPLSRA